MAYSTKGKSSVAKLTEINIIEPEIHYMCKNEVEIQNKKSIKSQNKAI